MAQQIEIVDGFDNLIVFSSPINTTDSILEISNPQGIQITNAEDGLSFILPGSGIPGISFDTNPSLRTYYDDFINDINNGETVSMFFDFKSSRVCTLFPASTGPNTLRILGGQTAVIQTATNQPAFRCNTVVEVMATLNSSPFNASRSYEFNAGNRHESRYNNNNQLQARMAGTTTTCDLNLPDTPQYAGRVVYSVNSGGQRLVYKDGERIGFAASLTADNVSSLRLGDRRTSASRRWNGDMYAFYASSRLYTEDELRRISRGELSLLDDAEVAYYNFTQEDADNRMIPNRGTSNGWDLTMANTGWEIINPYVEEEETPDPTITITDRNPESYQSQPFGYLNGIIATDYLGNDITNRITTTANGAPITSPLQFAGLTPSTYSLTYSVVDDFNNTASETITLTILPVPDPTLTVSNRNPEIFEGEPYNYLDGVSAEDFFGTPLTVRVNVGSDNISDPSYFESLSEGQYTIAYNAIDSLYNFTQELATLTVSASPAPIITAPVSSTIQRGESFAYLNGVSATDFEGNDLTLAIETTVDGQVITNPNYFATLLSGSYTISYSVRDRLNQITNRTQTLTINRNPAPTLTVFDRTPQITLGESFAYLGNVEAEDFEGNDLTGNIFTLIDGDLIFEPTFTPERAGTYTILYTVDDRYGEFAQETIALTVMEPVVITKPALIFNGTNSGFTQTSQPGFLINTIYMEVEFDVSPGAQQVYFNTHVADNGMLSQAGGIEVNSFGTNGAVSRYTGIPNGYKQIVLQWDESTSRYRMHVNGQLFTGSGPITRLEASQFVLGRFGTGGRNSTMKLYDIRFNSVGVSDQQIADIFAGDLSSIEQCEVIYNDFREDERDNQLIENRGLIQGFYDLTSTNLIFLDPLPAVEPPKEGVLVGDNYLIYRAKPKHIDCDNASSRLTTTITDSFDLDVIKLSFFYRQPISTAGRLVSLGHPDVNGGNRNMIRLQDNNRLVIQPNGDNNDASIPVMQLEAPNFRFMPNTYYNMVIKYDTSINNYKVWINGRLIDMGYQVGQENQRMFVEGILINNRQIADRGANMEFYSVSFEKSQLDDEECLRLSRNFTEALNDIIFRASSTQGEPVSFILDEMNPSSSLVINNAPVIEDELKPLSCIVGDGRVIIPLPVAQEEWILTTDGGVVDLSVLPQGDYSIIATNNSGPAPFGALSSPGYGTRQSSRTQTTFLVDRAFVGVEDSTLTGAQSTTLCIRDGKHFFTTDYLSDNGIGSEPYLQSATKDGLLTGAFASGWTIRAKRLSNFYIGEKVYEGGQDIDISDLPIGEYSIIARRKDGSTGLWALNADGYSYASANSALTNKITDQFPLIPIVNSTANTAGTSTLSVRVSAHSITNTYITSSLSNAEKAYIHGYKSGKVIEGIPSNYEIVIKPLLTSTDSDLIRIPSVNNSFDISNLENGDYIVGMQRSFTTSIQQTNASGSSGRAVFSNTATSSTTGRVSIFNSTSETISLSKLYIREGVKVLRSFNFTNNSGIFLFDVYIDDVISVSNSSGSDLLIKKINA